MDEIFRINLDQALPLVDIDPLEDLILTDIFTATRDFGAMTLYADGCVPKEAAMSRDDLTAALRVTKVTGALKDAAEKALEIYRGSERVAFFVAGETGWEEILRSIVKRSPSLEFVTLQTIIGTADSPDVRASIHYIDADVVHVEMMRKWQQRFIRKCRYATKNPALNEAQKILRRVYGDGDYEYIESVNESMHVGDTLFTFLMIELGAGEDCDSTREAIHRVDNAAAELQRVRQALYDSRKPGS